MKSWGKVAVATRIGGRPDALFFTCWTRLVTSGLRRGDAVIAPAIEVPHHFGANIIAGEFLKNTEADSLLFIDDDMVFERDDLSRLRDDAEGQEYDIISGLYCTRRPPHAPIVIRERATPDERGSMFDSRKELINGHVVPVDVVGLAFTMIRRSVFEAVAAANPKALLFFHWGSDGCGEDTYFCRMARAVGARIGVHTGLIIGHRVPMTVRWDNGVNVSSFDQFDRLFS